MIFPVTLHSQCPRGNQRRIVTNPNDSSLGDGAKPLQSETGKAASRRRVRIEEINITGAPGLEESIRARILDGKPENGFESDTDWDGIVRYVAELALADHGYCDAAVSAESRVLSRDGAEELVSVYIQVLQGQRYHLGSIHFTGAHAFPPWELRSRFPLADGQVFDISKIREGLEALIRLYGTKGYINFTASPTLTPSRDHRLMSVVFDVDEGTQFRVGSVQVLGLDAQVSSGDLNIKLHRGDLFNSGFVEDFFQDNKSVLPTGVSSRQNVEIKQNLRQGTVAIVFDLRSGPQDSSQ